MKRNYYINKLSELQIDLQALIEELELEDIETARDTGDKESTLKLCNTASLAIDEAISWIKE